jgi:hypothetical protein
MRILLSLLLVPLLSLSAYAQTGPANPEPEHKRLSWEQRFVQANATHDGHLTRDQAKIGYATVARHFRDIDNGGKGYVTEDDVRAWHQQQRAARPPNRAAARNDGLRPRQAMHQALPGQYQYNSMTTHAPDAPPDAAVDGMDLTSVPRPADGTTP